MSIRLPRTANVMPAIPHRTTVVQSNWGYHDGIFLNGCPENDLNYQGLGVGRDGNIMNFRFDCNPGFTIPSDKSFVIGAAMTVTNDRRGELPMQVGCHANMHSVPAAGSPPEDFRFVLCQQVTRNSTAEKYWQIVIPLHMNVHVINDSTNHAIYNYSSHQVVAITMTPNDPDESTLTGLVGLFGVFYNSADAGFIYDYFTSEVAMHVGYKNRAVYNPELN